MRLGTAGVLLARGRSGAAPRLSGSLASRAEGEGGLCSLPRRLAKTGGWDPGRTGGWQCARTDTGGWQRARTGVQAGVVGARRRLHRVARDARLGPHGYRWLPTTTAQGHLGATPCHPCFRPGGSLFSASSFSTAVVGGTPSQAQTSQGPETDSEGTYLLGTTDNEDEAERASLSPNLLQRIRSILTNTPSQRTLETAYSLETVLGSGRFGVVWRATDRETGKAVAVKSIRKENVEDKQAVAREVDILTMVRRNCKAKGQQGQLLNFIEAFEDLDHVHIVSELYEGGELFDRIVDRGANQYRESDAAKIFLQILLSLKELHTQGVTHRDLKPENICFVDDTQDSPVVLVDFGHACRFDKPTQSNGADSCASEEKEITNYLSDPTGSMLYVAPEVLDKRYTETADLWSAGVVLYVLLTGAPPFNHETQEGIEAQIRQGIYGQDRSDGWHFITTEGRNLCDALLTVDPNERISLDDAIQHPWFRCIEMGDEHELALPASTVQALRKFTCNNRLKSRACRIMARNAINVAGPQLDWIGPLRKIFSDLDHNGDGIVNINELGAGLKNLGIVSTVADIERLCREIDSNQDGEVCFEEFLAAAAEHEILRTHVFQVEGSMSLRTVFETFCEGPADKISQSTLHEIFGGNREDLNTLLEKFDADGDGWIDFEEFRTMMAVDKSPLEEVTKEDLEL